MGRLKLTDEWWSAPTEAENGRVIIVTGRRDLDEARALGVFNYRVEVTWTYESDRNGMPRYKTSMLMDEVNTALSECFRKDPVAIITGIYTGDGERNWVFYTRSLHIFQRKFNEALAQFEQLPLSFYAEEDPDWTEYEELLKTEITEGTD